MDVNLAAPPTLNECGPKKAALSPTARAPALTAADTREEVTRRPSLRRRSGSTESSGRPATA